MEEKDIKKEETKEVHKKVEKPRKGKNKDQEEIIRLTTELGNEKEKSMRIQAEMLNFKKRKEDEVANMYKYANEDILKKLLLVTDNFERALVLETEENKEFIEGFKMIYKRILDILAENEVVEIEAINCAFDPSIHQAIMTEKHEDVESGVVIEVLQKGYKYKDRVLRPSMVKVNE